MYFMILCRDILSGFWQSMRMLVLRTKIIGLVLALEEVWGKFSSLLHLLSAQSPKASIKI